jgi:multidrug transporter EmrE-like cation transporter
MNLTAFALVVAAACLHALWNLAAKRAAGNLGVLWLGLCLSGVALAPVALYDAWQSFDPAGLAYIAATGLIHAAYFGLLAAGYRRGELSVVYPLAGVAGTALVAGAVIGEGISAAGAAGIGSVCLGVLALGLRELRRPLYRPVLASPYSVRPFRTG